MVFSPERGDALEAVLFIGGLAFLASAIATLVLCLLWHVARHPLRRALDIFCSVATVMLICSLLFLVAAPIVLALLGGGERAGGRGREAELLRPGAGEAEEAG